MDKSFAFDSTATCRIVLDHAAEMQLPDLVGRLNPDGVVVVHDAALSDLSHRIAHSLGARAQLPIVADEVAKQLEVVGQLAEQLHDTRATRRTALVAVGGGTITDLAGFVASIYLRGMPFVSCPTTTLAMCDATLGGKNGVDHCGLKNRLGTIRQPELILIDPAWLRTLPDELYLEGLIEVVKMAAVLDAGCFDRLEEIAHKLRARDAKATHKAISMAIDMKMAVVLADEREGDRRRALNAGHTIGHAIESLAGGELRHGHAVAMGMVAECRAAGVDARVLERIASLLRAIGAPTDVPAHLIDVERLWHLAQRDKKALRGGVPMCVPDRIGKWQMVELTEERLQQGLV